MPRTIGSLPSGERDPDTSDDPPPFDIGKGPVPAQIPEKPLPTVFPSVVPPL